MQEPVDGQDDIEIIVDYNIILGKGGVASVYQGTFGGSPAAIKRIQRTYDYINRELVPLRRELKHENIVNYNGSRKDADFIYIAMEVCAGNLDHLVKGSYTGQHPGTMAEMMLQVTLGLQYLHSQNILHRDLKPGNVLISIPEGNEKPKMKLADFGFCKETQDGSSNSLSYSGVGTEGWRAPECCRSDSSTKKPTYTKLSDIFSLGCVFGYAFSKGHHPFGNVIILRPANIIRGSLDTANLELITDAPLKQLIIKMISHTATDRPQLGEILEHPTFFQ